MSQAKSIDMLNRVLIGPLVSEKATRSGDRENSVAFWVNPTADKDDIRQAVEMFFPGTKVESVRTAVKHRDFVRFGQTSGRAKKKKKAYVKLAPGTEINFAEFEKA